MADGGPSPAGVPCAAPRAATMAPGLGDLDEERVSLAAAAANGGDAVAAAAAAELGDGSAHDAGAGRADRMAEGDGAALGVDDGRVEAELGRGRQGDGGEGFVDLPDVDVGRAEALLVEELLGGHRRDEGEVRRVPGDAGVIDDLGEGFDAVAARVVRGAE